MFNSLTYELTTRRTVDVVDEECAPWNEIRNGIESVVLLEGAASIHSQTFMDCQRMKSVQIQKTVTLIGEEHLLIECS